MLYFGRSYARGQSIVNGTTLNVIDVQRDLMVQVHNSLKVGKQIYITATDLPATGGSGTYFI